MNVGNWNINENARYLQLQSTNVPPTSHGLTKSFEELVSTNVEIVQELLDLHNEIVASQKKLRIAKVTGTSVGALGATSLLASLALAPFTAGASTMLTVAGFTASIASGVSAAGTEIVGHVKTKDYIKRIKSLQTKQETIATNLTDQLGVTGLIVQELTNSGVSEEIALSTTVSYIQQIFSPTSNNESFNLQSFTNQLQLHINAVRNLASVTIGLGPASTSLGTLTKESIKSAAKQIGEITAAEFQNLRTTLKVAADNVTTRVVAKRLGIIASVIFTIVDITFLVKNWSNEHPLMETIETLVHNLIQDCEKCREMISTFSTLGLANPNNEEN